MIGAWLPNKWTGSTVNSLEEVASKDLHGIIINF